jgi:succinate dehydrogenase/fumarate reductase-like Fe-S protein
MKIYPLKSYLQIEDLVVDHKLINVYLDQIEAFK